MPGTVPFFQKGWIPVLNFSVNPIGSGIETEKFHLVQQKLSTDWNSIRQDPSKDPRIRHFAGENFWVRKILMAEYANPCDDAPSVLSSMINLLTPVPELTAQNQELTAQNQELTIQLDSIRNSRTWKTMGFWRRIRSKSSVHTYFQLLG